MKKEESSVNRVSEKEIWVNKFTEESASSFRKDVLDKLKIDPSYPVIIHINSYGGQVDSLAKMIETIDECRLKYGTKFITVCVGKAMSCGAMLLSHGDIRFCAPMSRVMVHEVSSGTNGDVHDMVNDAAETKRLNEVFMGLLAKNCKIQNGYNGLRKLIKDRDGREVWMDARQSLDFGIVDYVGVPVINEKVVYEVCNLNEHKKIEQPKKEKKKSKRKV